MKILTIWVFLSVLFFNSSCVLTLKKAQKEIEIDNYNDLKSSENPPKLSYACDCENRTEEGFTELGSPVFRSNPYSYTILKVEKKGFIPEYIKVPKRFNPYAIPDFIIGGILLGGSGLFALDAYIEDGEYVTEKLFGAIGGGILSVQFIGNGIIYRKANVKNMLLNPDLKPFPTRSDSMKYVEIENINLSAEDFSYLKYKNERRFLKESKSGESTIEMDDGDFRIDYILNQFLYKSGFHDTLNAVKSKNNTVILEVDISELTIHRISSEELAAFEFKIDWIFRDLLSKKVILKETTNYKSQLLVYRDDFLHDYFENILANSFSNLINKNDVSRVLKLETEEENFYSEELEIRNDSVAVNLTEAINSSVIVKGGKFFKSGVIISTDGYILTELGSLPVNEEKIEIIFSDNTSANGEIVRSSRKHNIALIKVDKNNLMSVGTLDKAEMKNVKTGMKAFSIGSAGDIRLGHSLNNGVISGVRNINDEKFIQTDLSMSVHSEGSPIFTEDAKLIAIMTSNNMNHKVEGINFSVPVDVIFETLNIVYIP